MWRCVCYVLQAEQDASDPETQPNVKQSLTINVSAALPPACPVCLQHGFCVLLLVWVGGWGLCTCAHAPDLSQRALPRLQLGNAKYEHSILRAAGGLDWKELVEEAAAQFRAAGARGAALCSAACCMRLV